MKMRIMGTKKVRKLKEMLVLPKEENLLLMVGKVAMRNELTSGSLSWALAPENSYLI